MADIPGIPMPDPPPRPKVMRRVTTGIQWAENGPLAPWMHSYLQWLAGEKNGCLSVKGGDPGRRFGVTWSQKTAKANRLSSRKINMKVLRTLEQRADAIAYFEKLRVDLTFRARELMSDDIATNIEARREGLEAARSVQDHKAIKGYTDWVPDVAFPKKALGEDVAPRVIIHLGSKDAARLIGKVLNEPAEEISDIEYEVIEPKQLTDGEEE
jgi:hypothetical protein